MKAYLLILIVNVQLCIASYCNGQIADSIYLFPQEFAEMSGGVTIRERFFSDNLHYPSGDSTGKEGRLWLSFLVDTSGSVRELKILRGLSPAIDSEALRAAQLMPKWKAARNNGVLVTSRINIPLDFTKGMKPPGMHTEQMPSFPGGWNAYQSFMIKNLRVPSNALLRRTEGVVKVRFVIGEDGSLSNITIPTPLDEDLDAEAIRFIGSMPRWQPAMQDNKPVRVAFVLPIIFRSGLKATVIQPDDLSQPVYPNEYRYMNLDGSPSTRTTVIGAHGGLVEFGR